MFKLINGWTKETVMAQIRKYNDGKPARDDYGCSYKTSDNNRCAIGCFIPDNHAAFNVEGVERGVFGGDVTALIKTYPDLANIMPFEINAASKFQWEHDHTPETESVYDSLQRFLDIEVE